VISTVFRRTPNSAGCESHIFQADTEWLPICYRSPHGCLSLVEQQKSDDRRPGCGFIAVRYARLRQCTDRPRNVRSDPISGSHRTGNRVALQKVQRGVLDRNRIPNDCRSGRSESGELRFDAQSHRGRTLPDAACNASRLRRPEYEHSKFSRHANRRL
jgi:hypothetical protein